MSATQSLQSQPLEKPLRNKLERTVKEARDVAEEAAWAACEQLGVGLAKPDAHLGADEKDLRRRLRIHGRQLGDKRDAKGKQDLDRLVNEIAYEHWHRMLFARFLAENDLLMYPDPDDPVSVSIEDCEELAADEGAKNGWELAARFAARMLPQIFRTDSPVFSLALPPESQQRLEQLLSELPDEAFTASDSLGWVYQFWQAKRKDQVNASEVKIGARELPAVTQLFTEPYMVSFLLDNSLGAWWAARRLSEEELATASSEQELRDKASLPGVPLDYLRFVKVEESGRWEPAAGTFDAWPERLSELKTLDPCCGSGHFLVAALLMLVPMRMDLEGLPARDAVDRVLTENLHGLEIDQRCVELAAFALALTAWRFPEAGGYRPLPDLNVACCGLSVSVAKEEWKKLAKDNNQLKIALDWMYDEFKDALVLGSLLNPAKSMAAKVVEWDQLSVSLTEALQNEDSVEHQEIAVAAQGLARAALIMSDRFHFVATNVPYLARLKQGMTLRKFGDRYNDEAKNDLANLFVVRCLEYCATGGVCQLVVPHNWLFLSRFQKHRKTLLTNFTWTNVSYLGAGAFSSISGEVVKAALVGLSNDVAEDSSIIRGVNSLTVKTWDEKAHQLRVGPVLSITQSQQLHNPDQVISFEPPSEHGPLSEYAASYQGAHTYDINRFRLQFFELHDFRNKWNYHSSSPSGKSPFAGHHFISFKRDDENEFGQIIAEINDNPDETRSVAWKAGNQAWGRRGIACAWMNKLPVSLYHGCIYDNSVALILPKSPELLPSIWAFCSSDDFNVAVRKINKKMQVANTTLVKVPFDLAHWQQVASEKFPHGLPEPYSDDPTQWIFHGHPTSSTAALQVAVARLLGYRWPAELDEDVELSDDARQWRQHSRELTTFADNDGIVCIPAVGTEQPAEDRLLNLLHRAYEDGRAMEELFQEKLAGGDTNDSLTVALMQRSWHLSLPSSFNDWLANLLAEAGHKGKTLQTWLRDKFFTQHCKLFRHRPFVWHVWDGLKDGFSVLINYHKLDNKLLETLIYTYLNDWINRQKRDRDAGVDGSEEKLAAAEWLKERLEWILEGESPNDIFVRWKSLEEQSIGWNPDINDGVRLNIRPWMTVDDAGKKGAGLLRDKPNIHWKKDRGKDVESAPWYDLGPEYGGKQADRINEHSLTLEEKHATRKKG